MISMLGPKWRFHYYAHLKDLNVGSFELVNKEQVIGTVGTTGNAAGKQPHLHYSIITPIPIFGKLILRVKDGRKCFI